MFPSSHTQHPNEKTRSKAPQTQTLWWAKKKESHKIGGAKFLKHPRIPWPSQLAPLRPYFEPFFFLVVLGGFDGGYLEEGLLRLGYGGLIVRKTTNLNW